MSELTCAPATLDDMDAFYGVPMHQSFVAIKVMRDGEVIGIGGAIWDGYWYSFMDVKEDANPTPKEIVKGTRIALEVLDRRARRLIAVPRDEQAIGFLTHYNYAPMENGVYERRPG